jgi:phage tail-like protein
MTSHAPEHAAPTAGPAAAAARFSITIDGVEIASFSELVELFSGIDPSALALGSDQKGRLALKKLPGKRVPPTVTLRRGHTNDSAVFAWHSDALRAATGRRDAVLVAFSTVGEPVARYTLESAWPSLIEISGLKAGASEVLMETVTIVCEDIQPVGP